MNIDVIIQIDTRITRLCCQCEVQCELSITDEEKQQLLVAAANFSLDNRPFLASLFSCLDYSDNDYFQLFALCLFYAMQVTCDSIWNFGIFWR